MAKRRADDFDLRSVMARRDFTPADTDVPALLSLATSDDEDVARDATLALARVPELALAAVGERRLCASARERARMARILTRFPEDGARTRLLELITDEASVVRRAAAQALARVGGEGVEDALLRCLPCDDAAERRAIAMALGRTGGVRSAEVLAAIDPEGDEALGKIVERARLMLRRTETRTESVSLDPSASRPSPVLVELLCRSGLETMLAASLRGIDEARDVKVSGRGVVRLRLHGAPIALAASRLFYELRFPLPDRVAAMDFEANVADVLAGPLSRALLATFTVGTPRIRVAFEDGRKRRAAAWSIASALDARGIINDTEGAPWKAHVRIAEDGSATVGLVPRGLCDARFAYRVADVPASTHPTIAAAMARLCPVSASDVVWDPFCGAGVELVERARLGPYAMLIGTDTSNEACAAARQNLASAGVSADVRVADATTFAPPHAPTTIITNPPMGRRVHRGDSAAVLDAFIAQLGRVAAPHATLVWLNPSPNQTGPALERIGFALESSFRVDMGGFDVSLERRRRGPSV